MCVTAAGGHSQCVCVDLHCHASPSSRPRSCHAGAVTDSLLAADFAQKSLTACSVHLCRVMSNVLLHVFEVNSQMC